MTIFEEYLSSRKEERKLEVDYVWSFRDYYNNMRNNRRNITIAKNNIHTCKESLDKLDEIIKKRKGIVNKICGLSFVTDNEAYSVLPKVIKDSCFEDYEFKSLIIDDVRRVFLLKKGSSLDFDLTMDNLLTNEDVIFLASTELKTGFNLYQLIPDTEEIGSELNGNLYNSKFMFLKEFIDGYISTKAEIAKLTLEDYYISTRGNIKHGYDEELIEFYGLEDAYEQFDKKDRRRAKRRSDDYYHKKQRDAKNQAIARRNLGKLPEKYNQTYEDVDNLTFIRRLELMVGRRFSSLEKDTIKSWLILGFDEDIIIEAYKEASIRGNYNNSAVAKILNDLTANATKDYQEFSKNVMLLKEFKKQ